MTRVDTSALRDAVLATIQHASINAPSKSISVLEILDRASVMDELRKLPNKRNMTARETDIAYVRAAIRSLRRDGEINCTGSRWAVLA